LFYYITGFPRWNLSNLESRLKHLKLGTPKPPGIQTTMVYAGGPGSHFNPHVEENLLYSINYVFPVSKSIPSKIPNFFHLHFIL
jgi:hypothetical protein